MPAAQFERLRDVASRHGGLRLLVLHGSRARGDHRGQSDWDFGYLGDPGFDPDGLRADLVHETGSDDVDLADLARASGQLRYRAAADARVLLEREPDAFASFWFDAVSYWCDMQDVLRTEYDATLARLPS
jgi:predicted nucleotidyltransferase